MVVNGNTFLILNTATKYDVKYTMTYCHRMRINICNTVYNCDKKFRNNV
jgi:hypothetical protein